MKVILLTCTKVGIIGGSPCTYVTPHIVIKLFKMVE
jgi:hypothetical protein